MFGGERPRREAPTWRRRRRGAAGAGSCSVVVCGVRTRPRVALPGFCGLRASALLYKEEAARQKCCWRLQSVWFFRGFGSSSGCSARLPLYECSLRMPPRIRLLLEFRHPFCVAPGGSQGVLAAVAVGNAWPGSPLSVISILPSFPAAASYIIHESSL